MPHILNLGTIWSDYLHALILSLGKLPQYVQSRKQVENQKHVIISWHVIVYVAGTIFMRVFHVQKVSPPLQKKHSSILTSDMVKGTLAIVKFIMTKGDTPSTLHMLMTLV